MTVWDDWRANYDALTFEEHQEFNAQVAERYPRQQCFNATACREFLAERQPRRVVELGGWDGELAGLMLPAFPRILDWANYDITPVTQSCTHPVYRRVLLDDWPWNRVVAGDALIASHVFEHMRGREIGTLLDRWNVQSVFVDCPIDWQGHPWNGYEGTHILELGIHDLVGLFTDRGYTVEMVSTAPSFIGFFDR